MAARRQGLTRDRMPSLRKSLRDEWYEWEQLGRGHLVWDRPVVPEPYFVPFLFHGQFVAPPRPADDGRLGGRLGGVLGRLWGRDGEPDGAEPEDPLSPLRSGAAPDRSEDRRREIREAGWRLPPDLPWRPSAFAPALDMLGRADHPVCLEAVAAGGAVELQWVVEEADRNVLHDALADASLPPTLEWREDWLASLVFESELPSLWCGELALQNEFFIPIRTSFASDPLRELFSVLNRVEPDAVAVVQVAFQSCREAWAESVWRLVTCDDGKAFFPDRADFPQAAKLKCREPMFAATVRISVLGSGEEQVGSVARGLARCFACYAEGNAFVLARPQDGGFGDALTDILCRRSRRSGMILNADELLSIVHPPAAGVGAPGLRRQRRRTHPAPPGASSARGLVLGTNEHGSERATCGLAAPDRLRHMHVLGASGTGKSTFLLRSILQDLESGHGVGLLDPHGDLVDAVLERLPESRVGDVLVFDPSDEEWPVGFNILRAHTSVERNLLASDFVAIFERLSTSWGDQMTAVLGNAALAILESERGGTLLDLKRFLIDDEFRRKFLPSVGDPEIRYFWEREFKLLRGNTQASLVTRLNAFLRHRLVRNMVCQGGERFDVARMMDEGRIVLARLSQGLIGQENSWLLGSLLVSRFHQAALSRQSLAEESRRPFFLYLDEAHNFVTPSIASILSGARKYGLGLVLAHQEIDQFPSRESGILGAILTNCHTRVYFRLGDRDAGRLEQGFDHFGAEDFRRLGTGEAICRVGGSDGDFSLSTSGPPCAGPGGAERREAALASSRRSFASSRQQVEDAAAGPMRGGHAAPEGSSCRPARKPVPGTPDSPGAGEAEPAGPPPPGAQSVPGAPPAPEGSDPAGGPVSGGPGRGGDRHKAVQELILHHANCLGLGAELEAVLPDGSGSVDVLVRAGSETIAFEFAHRSPLAQEVRNIAKALESGIRRVVVVSDSRKHLDAIRDRARDAGMAADGAVRFIETKDAAAYFAELGAGLAGYQTSSRGYAVRVTHSPLTEEEQRERIAAIHRAIAEHQRERRGPGNVGTPE